MALSQNLDSPIRDKWPRPAELYAKAFFQCWGSYARKKLFPLTMQGKQAYSKFEAPIETGLQTMS